ncbi:uncharacterized protein LOC115998916 [Ipomoea triloba]|uniref:uncharacterized protein LOC115998916 n=1 Tax=Ipomoea triloba TaxID=35885 RepID=UPI00125D8F40|nr:uncharacterized protein LOC115998916 [Ipomoea triloba]
MATEEQRRKAMKTRYENRKASVLKKGKELSMLYDVKVCVIMVSPDGKLETWPDNLNDVKAVLSAVKESRCVQESRFPSPLKARKYVENCGNNGAGVVDEEELYDVSGADQENNNAKQDNNFGIGIPGKSLVDDMRVNQTPTSHYSYYQWNENGNGESNCEKFGKYIGDMVRNQEWSYYGCGGSSSAMNPKTQFCNMQPNQDTCSAMNPKTQFCNMQPNQDTCSSPDQYEIGSSSTSGLNFSNQQQPTPLFAYHQQQYVTYNSSALNTTGVNNNLVHPNQQPTLAYQQYPSALNSGVNYPNQEPTLPYQQYLMGNSSAFNSGVNYPNQEPSRSLAYQHYDIGIWD